MLRISSRRRQPHGERLLASSAASALIARHRLAAPGSGVGAARRKQGRPPQLRTSVPPMKPIEGVLVATKPARRSTVPPIFSVGSADAEPRRHRATASPPGVRAARRSAAATVPYALPSPRPTRPSAVRSGVPTHLRSDPCPACRADARLRAGGGDGHHVPPGRRRRLGRLCHRHRGADRRQGVLALFLPVVVGARSDRLRTRIGGRLPFVLAGVPVMALALVLLGLQDELWPARDRDRSVRGLLRRLRAVPLDVPGSGARARRRAVAERPGGGRGIGTALALVGGGLLLAIAETVPFVVAAGVLLATTGAFVWALLRRELPLQEEPVGAMQAEPPSGRCAGCSSSCPGCGPSSPPTLCGEGARRHQHLRGALGHRRPRAQPPAAAA